MKYLFFGASVTQQSTRHDDSRVITGYVNHLQNIFAKERNFEIARVSCPSNSINDAGLVYLDLVVSENPDFCFLEWSTPEFGRCEKDVGEYIYYKLISDRIVPVLLVLPRADRLNSMVHISRKLRSISEDLELPIIDLSTKYMPDSQYLRQGLRDSVHTNEKGALMYAQELATLIRNNLNDPGSYLDSISPKPPLNTFEVTRTVSDHVKPRCKSLVLSIETIKPCEVVFYAEQRLGPWSCYCHLQQSDNFPISAETSSSVVSLSDPWTHRERQALKILGTTQIKKAGLTCIRFTSSEYSDRCVPNDSEIRVKGLIFAVSDSSVLNISIKAVL